MSEPSARAPRRRWPRRLLALALSGVLALVLGELFVRVFVGAPLRERLPILRVRSNELRGWEMLPSELHYTYLHPVRMNALGLRGAEVAPEKGAETRVLVLGDSLVYGQGVGDEDTPPAALERALNARDPAREWRAINSGHRGYATNQELGLLRELGPRLAPDVVVLTWYPNDLLEPNVTELAHRLEASGTVAFDTKSDLKGRELFLWHAKQWLRRSALVMFVYDSLGLAAGRPIDERTAEQGFARLESHLDDFIAQCRDLGAAPLVALLPESGAVAGPHPTDRLHVRVAELARARGLTVVDLKPPLVALREELGRVPILLYDGHYDERANRALGEALVEPVLAQLELGAPGR